MLVIKEFVVCMVHLGNDSGIWDMSDDGVLPSRSQDIGKYVKLHFYGGHFVYANLALLSFSFTC
jgi:hypothetical protein